MQAEKVLGILLAAACLATPGRAAPSLSLRGRADAAARGTSLLVRDMPVTTHDKDAGSGYNQGSPLYEKQQMRGKTKPPEPPSAPLIKDGMDAVPTKLDANDIKNAPETYEKFVVKRFSFWNGVAYFFTFVLTWCLLGLIWVKAIGRHKVGYKERERDPRGFTYGLFSLDHCFGHHANVCLCAWCCFPLRLADTYSKEPHSLVSSFMKALVAVSCVLALVELSVGMSHLLFIGMAVYFRQQLRKVYSLPNGDCSTFTQDCLTWCCCPFCAAAQEARQVEFVTTKDVPPESKPGAYVPGTYSSQKSFNGF